MSETEHDTLVRPYVRAAHTSACAYPREDPDPIFRGVAHPVEPQQPRHFDEVYIPSTDRARFTMHLPIKATDLAEALRVAERLTGALAWLGAVVAQEVHVAEGNGEPQRVFCDNLTITHEPCMRRYRHPGGCD